MSTFVGSVLKLIAAFVALVLGLPIIAIGTVAGGAIAAGICTLIGAFCGLALLAVVCGYIAGVDVTKAAKQVAEKVK